MESSGDAARERAQNILKRLRATSSTDTVPSTQGGHPKVAPTSLQEMAKAVLDRDADWQGKYGVPNPYFGARDGFNTASLDRAGRPMINFAGYNYLGLANDPSVIAAAAEATEKFGTSASASRIASGELPLHRELERGIANLLGVDDSLVYNSGYGTNISTIAHLLGPGDAIFHDDLIHNSGLMGAMLSGAARIPFRHNDVEHLEAQLHARRGQFKRALIIVEGVYSMDGDIPNLPAILALRDQFNADIMVDEAHSLGVLGRTGKGLSEHFGIDPTRVDVWMGTLSKSLASCGGYIAGEKNLIEYLRYTSPGFVYSCGLSPADTAAALAALNKMKAEPERVQRLQDNAAYFLAQAKAAGLDTGQADGTSVVPWIVGTSKDAMRVADAMNGAGTNVQPILHPSVEEGQARLRFFVSSEHTKGMIDKTIKHAKHASSVFLQGGELA